VLVLGGSQGARTLNENVPAALGAQSVAITVRHQCGGLDLEVVKGRYVAAGLSAAEVLPFIDDMPQALREADLVISRSGASAVSEICAIGRASLLVPFPFAAGNHQQKNAEALVEAGAAYWLHNTEATCIGLTRTIAALLEAPNRLKAMADMARSIGRPEAAAAIAEDLMELAKLAPRSPSHAPESKETK
jgi:UDP-N-acetylglucosamine--N-acetylmuramyl-(pentapeptide) pyrophosphoryl-undecaprenol N-acetylglucosamine transferase